MTAYVVRLWLPDRPGALGALSSRLGQFGANLAEIAILERDGGRAMDELTVEVADNVSIQWLIDDIDGIAGISVEHARRADSTVNDVGLEPVELAARVLACRTPSSMVRELCAAVANCFGAQWSACVQPRPLAVLDHDGEVPSATWLSEFIATAPPVNAKPASSAPSDVAWTSLEAAGLALVVGREGRPFRSKERRALAALGAIAGLHWIDCSWAE